MVDVECEIHLGSSKSCFLRLQDFLGCFTFLCITMMFNSLHFALALAGASVVLADSYKLAYSVPWSPKNTTSVDQGAIYNGTYYLSDRVNGGVHVVDLAKGKQIALILGFTGLVTAQGVSQNNVSGPNGLIVLPDRNELYVGDSPGIVRVIDLFTNEIVANISTNIKTRADEMAYDAYTGTLVVTLPNEKPPQVAIISTTDRKVTGKISFQNATELEQPVFNEVTRQFYVAVPSTGANPGGEIASIDVSALNISRTLPLDDCVPAGIVFGPGQNLFVSCSQDQIIDYNVAYSQVLDVASGRVLANISGVAGSDQVAYDPNAKLYFASAYQNLVGAKKDGAPMPQLAVIDATSNTLIQTWATDSKLAHSVAVDYKTNQVVVPLLKSGITVYNLTAASSSSNSSSTPSSTTPSSSSTAAVHTTNTAGQWNPSMSLVIGVFALAIPLIGY